MLVMLLLAALGSSVPQADINKICERARTGSLPEERATAMRGCVGDETSARDELRRDWLKKYSAADKNNCAPTPGMQFSYVELLTCLQMQHGGNFTPPSTPSTPRPPAAAKP
jgi:hypothetical protein